MKHTNSDTGKMLPQTKETPSLHTVSSEVENARGLRTCWALDLLANKFTVILIFQQWECARMTTICFLFRAQYTNFSKESDIPFPLFISNQCLLVRPPWWDIIATMLLNFGGGVPIRLTAPQQQEED